MKFSLILLSLMIVGNSAHAAVSMYVYTVYAKDLIRAGCSDYQGRTAVGGVAQLHDFQVVKADNKIGCALEAESSIDWLRGNTRDLKAVKSCVGAPHRNLVNVDTLEFPNGIADFDSLTTQIDNMSDFLSWDGVEENVRRITLNIDKAGQNGVIRLDGKANELLIVNVLESDVSIVGYDLQLSGGLSAKNLIWNFPNATKLKIANSGNKDLGMIGTFLAPKAEVNFTNALITGALYARSIIGDTDGATCGASKIHAGQVNALCIDGMIAGIGCGCAGYHHPAPAPAPASTPTPTPAPVQVPDQTQQPVPHPHQNCGQSQSQQPCHR